MRRRGQGGCLVSRYDSHLWIPLCSLTAPRSLSRPPALAVSRASNGAHKENLGYTWMTAPEKLQKIYESLLDINVIALGLVLLNLLRASAQRLNSGRCTRGNFLSISHRSLVMGGWILLPLVLT